VVSNCYVTRTQVIDRYEVWITSIKNEPIIQMNDQNICVNNTISEKDQNLFSFGFDQLGYKLLILFLKQ
jgi:hypothetical protein